MMRRRGNNSAGQKLTNKQMYINEDPEGISGIQRMKNAVWIDLINMLLWLISTVYMAFNWWRARTGRTQFTGRAANV